MRTLRLLLPPVLLLAGLSGCKQGIGDRCTLDSDCESGLQCSKGATRICENPSQIIADAASGNRDALVLPDTGFRSDAGPTPIPDAAVLPDASADAPIAEGGNPDAAIDAGI